jgi:hypothetical protein
MRLTIATSSIPSPSVAENIHRIWFVHLNPTTNLSISLRELEYAQVVWASARGGLDPLGEDSVPAAPRDVECLAFWYMI